MTTSKAKGIGSVYAFEIDITGSSSSTGVIASLQNTTGKDLFIVAHGLQIVTQSTGASTLDIGYTATSATTSSDTLIDGLSGAAAGYFTTPGTNGKAITRWMAGKWINVAEASGDVDGLVAKFHFLAKEL